MLDKSSTGLIIVDIQGKLARLVAESDTLLSNCRKLILGVQVLEMPIVWVEQNPDKLGATVDVLSELLTDLEPIPKFTFNACDSPDFMRALQMSGRQSWLVCGIEAHICVYQTAASLNTAGYDIHLVADCVSSRDPANKALALQKLIHSGVSITGLEMCLYELVKDCRDNAFRQILSLIK